MADATQLFKDDEQDRLGNGYTPDDNNQTIAATKNNGESESVSKSADSSNDENKPLTASNLATAEDTSTNSAGLYSGVSGDSSLSKKVGKFLVKNRKKGLLGGGIIGVIVGLLVTSFLALIPLKIEHIVQNLQKHFFATSESAIQSETQTLFESYIIKNVLPSYKNCGRVVTSKCKVSGLSAGKNPVTNLYKAWADSKLETKLASKYGIEFSFDKSGVWRLKAPGTSSVGDSLGKSPSVASLDNEFKRADRSEMRAAIKNAVNSETKWTQVFYRYKVGRLLEQKYGIKRCIVFCGTKDSLSEFSTSKKNAAKIFLVQRVITPLNASRGAILECLIDTKCTPEKADPLTQQGVDNGSLNGGPESSVDSNVRKSLEELAANYGITDSETIKKMISEYTKVSESGFQKYAITSVLEKLAGGQVASQVADAVPYIGWINFGAGVIAGAKNIGPAIKKISYISNSAAAVSLYMTYRTYADEIHTGNVDSTEVGSFVSSLGVGDSSNTNDPITGGVASAEDTPLYSYLINGSSASSISSVTSLLNGVAYAATQTTKSSYRCGDGNGVPNGKLVCSEEVLGKGSAAADGVNKFLGIPGISTITDLAGIIRGISSKLTSIIGAALNLVPGYGAFTNFVSKALSPVINGVVKFLVPSPFSSNMSGGRTFDMMAAGADVAGNDVAHTTIGGKKLTSTEVATIVSEQTQEAKQSFSNQSFFARIFDKNSPYSLISKVAMDIPLGFQSNFGSTIASIISSPFSSIFHGFSTLLSSPSASAAITPIDDPFNVVQYGYTSSDLAKIGDPEKYWDANCTDNAAQGYQNDNSWNIDATKNIDPNTGGFVNKDGADGTGGTNPCLLIKTAVGSAGAVFDTSLLSTGEL